jgi:hypothetical protein
MVCEAKRAQCTHENCPLKHLLTRPDPAEVERLLNEYDNAYLGFQLERNQYAIPEASDRLTKARADLLKLVGGE